MKPRPNQLSATASLTPAHLRPYSGAAALVLAALGTAGPLSAASITWTGGGSTDFETPGNWTGTTTPPTNNLTADIGVFSGTVTANQPSLSISRSITGLTFSTTTGGWNLGSSSSNNVLTLGASGITATAQTSGTTTISANLGIGATQTFGVGTGGTLLVNGSVSMGTSGTPVTQTLILGNTSATNNGTITINPTGTNSLILYSNVTGGQGTLSVNTGTAASAKIVNFGSGANSTTSTNIISNSVSGGIRTAFGATLRVNSGTWVTNDIGSGNSNVATGAIDVTGGTLRNAGGRYAIAYGTTATNGAGTLNVSGGAYIQTNAGNVVSNSGYLAIGNQGFAGTTAVASMNVSAGYVDLARSNTGSSTTPLQIGVTAGSGSQQNTALYNQSGGFTQIGVTLGSNVFTGVTNANAGTGVSIGGSTATGANNVSTALTLTGGRLNVQGTITGAGATTAGTGSIRNLNLMGGTITAQGIDMTRLGSNSTATATSNQATASNNIGTLVNYGSTIAPGGSLIGTSSDSFGNVTVSLTPTSGRTSITGNYQVNSGTLAVNLGGTTASTAFQDAANSGNFSNLAVSGTTVLGGNLTANLTNGSGGMTFIPASGNSFIIINSTGALSGTFTNAGAKVVLGNDPFSGSLAINYGANAVTLNNYTANEWQGNGGSNAWGTVGTTVWTNAVDPNAAGTGAKFGAAGTAATTVTLDANRTVGQLLFSSANYSIGGSSNLTLDNGASAASITLQDATTQTISAPITLNSDLIVTGFNGGTVVLGALTGAAKNLTANATGSTVTLTGANTYNNTTIASGVTLNVGNGGGTGSLGSGTTTNAGTLNFNRTGNLSVGSVISGAGSVNQVGSGITTLTSANTYTGATTITTGKLSIASTGSINSTSGVTIGTASTAATSEFNYNSSTALTQSVSFAAGSTGGTLSGTGTINQAVNITTGNTLAIGNSPGTMNFADTLGLNGTTIMEIDGMAGAGVTGGHDFANLTGIGAAGVLTYGGAMTLDMGVIFGTGSYSWNLFDVASETGTFATIALADKYSGNLLDADLNGVWDLTSGDNSWQFTESTGVLGLTVIPEPSALLLGGLGMLALLRRRRTV